MSICLEDIVLSAVGIVTIPTSGWFEMLGRSERAAGVCRGLLFMRPSMLHEVCSLINKRMLLSLGKNTLPCSHTG